MYGLQIPFTVSIVTACWIQAVLCNFRPMDDPLPNHSYQSPLIDNDPHVSFSDTWQILGPFRSGTRESVWGADPLEKQGGFRSLLYDSDATFNSALAINGTVKWKQTQADVSNPSPSYAQAIVKVRFPETDWTFLQSVYGWSALQYQAWARGFLTIHGLNSQAVALYGNGILEFWVDGENHFGGDFYRYHRAPVVLHLTPGHHVLDMRLVRDVRALGGVGEPDVEVIIEAEARHEDLTVDEDSLLVPDVARGKLGSKLASVNIQNNVMEEIEIISVSSSDAPQHRLALESMPLHISSHRARPLIFGITLGEPLVLNFTVQIAYRTIDGNTELISAKTIYIDLVERQLSEALKLTFLHPAKVVSYAILRPPPLSSACASVPREPGLPIILGLHGAGLEADSTQVREMLDAAYGICAWILLPSGVTPWSGDDWHNWGTADVKAAIAAIPNWVESVAWEGPGVSVKDWIVVGHSNGGQGTWYLSTHLPDHVIAAAPISGYSSIESMSMNNDPHDSYQNADLADYVPYSMWRDAEPSISAIIQKSRSTYKHELLLHNVAGIPILQQHGSEDDNVPPYHSRLMHELLGLSQWPSDYHELPGRGHWFEGVLTTPSLIEFYETAIMMPTHTKMPLEFTIIVPSSGDIGSKCGIFVDQLLTPDISGQIKVTRSTNNTIWKLQTQNIRRFHLSASTSRIGLPVALVLDNIGEVFQIDSETCEGIWYLKDVRGKWIASNETRWRHTRQRFGRQLGSMDAILRSDGAFTINMCSLGIESIAHQISRNLFQYFAADSKWDTSCGTFPSATSSRTSPQNKVGNVITLAVGDDLPAPRHSTFPIHSDRGRLVLSRRSLIDAVDSTAQVNLQSNQQTYRIEYDYEDGMGALFLRPLEDERLELVVWGADVAGLERAARLVPTITGVGQPDFLVLSDSCRWKGLAGLYAAGFLDALWQISPGSYIGGDGKLDTASRQ